MKKVVSGKDLQEKMLESIELLCGTVKKTLGPKGNNVLIDHSNYSPFITNDGVTIAKNIESDDESIGAILEIIKEASIKTNEEVGDGTTTTLVLLESIYKNSLEYISECMNPIILKKELDKSLEIILNLLENLKRKPTNNDIKNIASISAGDKVLGDFAYQVMNKVSKDAITIKEVTENELTVNYFKGYRTDTTLASPYFLNNDHLLNLNDAYILLYNTAFTDLEKLSFLLNDILKNKRSLVIIANNFSESVVEELVSISLRENIPICLLKIEEYGMHVYEILKDIECITNARIILDEDNVNSMDVGIINNIEITKDNIRINFGMDSNIKKYIDKLKSEMKEVKDDLEKSFYEKRIAMFTNGLAVVNIGAPTKTECLEKRMRFEDAICAISVTNEGVLTGGGISLLQISNKLNVSNSVEGIWKEVLKKPFEQILENAGQNISEIEKNIINNNYEVIYNVYNDTFEDKMNSSVIDPFLVIKKSLINAVSIAGMLLTTTSLVINEFQSNGKISEYNNWS